MSRHRHSGESRVTPATPAKARLLVERLRRRATRRKLILLECAVIRHAPFADCGRPLWDLIAGEPWFEAVLPPAWWVRLDEAGRKRDDEAPGGGRPWVCPRVSGHLAVEWVERYADGEAGEDELTLAQKYFHGAEYDAEAGRFNTPDDQRDELEIEYGAAHWLACLGSVLGDGGTKLWNVLDYYLATFPGQFDRWAGWRPLHPGHRDAATGLIEDIFGNPLRPGRFDPAWRTADAVAIATAMYEGRDFSPAPVLADALEDAGCDDEDILTHCRDGRRHVLGCRVVDMVLGKG